jgi:cation diffusion facilitator family transporter
MHSRSLRRLRHAHTFGQDARRPGEARTLVVIAITGVMMVVEIAAGSLFGSMALLADGLHMASHTAALTINAVAYVYARRHATDQRFSFGTGKVNTLAGFTGAVLLALFALLMGWESVARLLTPVPIALDQAIFVAVIGLIVNGVSALILDFRGDRSHEEHEHGHAHHDHNLAAAYLHVLADMLTSLLAIVALLAAKYFAMQWMDPVMGLVGALVVTRWSLGLARMTTAVLLDRTAPDEVVEAIRRSIENDSDNRIADLHVWSVGPSIYSATVSLVTHEPRQPSHYKNLVPAGMGLVHLVVEVYRCADEPGCAGEPLSRSPDHRGAG